MGSHGERCESRSIVSVPSKRSIHPSISNRHAPFRSHTKRKSPRTFLPPTPPRPNPIHAHAPPLQIPRRPPSHIITQFTDHTVRHAPSHQNLSKTAAPTATRPRPRNRTPPAPGQDGAAEQHHDRDPERHHLPPVGSHPGGRHLAAGARRRHRVRALPGGAGHRPGGLPDARLHRGARRRLLPRDMPPLVLPRRHVPAHRRPPRPHRLRLRRHAQGHRRGRLRPRIQGVPARGLLQLAAEAGGERQELEQDQGLPPGRQGLQVARGQDGDGRPVHGLRSLPHPVRLLQASDQLRLHLRQQHAVDRPGQVDGARLRRVVQRRGALLRLPVVQGRRGGHPEAQLEALRHHQHRLPRLHHHRLLRRLLRLQEQPPRPPQRRRVQAAGRVRLIHRLGYLFVLGWMRSSRRVIFIVVVLLLGWPDLALYRRDLLFCALITY